MSTAGMQAAQRLMMHGVQGRGKPRRILSGVQQLAGTATMRPHTPSQTVHTYLMRQAIQTTITLTMMTAVNSISQGQPLPPSPPGAIQATIPAYGMLWYDLKLCIYALAAVHSSNAQNGDLVPYV